MKIKSFLILTLLISISLTFINCTGDDDDDNPSINIFGIQDDKDLGLETKAQIEADAVNYPILDSAKYPLAYQQ